MKYKYCNNNAVKKTLFSTFNSEERNEIHVTFLYVYSDDFPSLTYDDLARQFWKILHHTCKYNSLASLARNIISNQHQGHLLAINRS